MSRSPLRKDKTCLNCNYVVENRFCPNCGQENTDTRKTFHHLFIHFFEDLTHYENAFWKTIKNLLIKPASLTKEYLSGKRLSYLAPVRLYIFISFVTFFLISVFPKGENHAADDMIDLDQTYSVKVPDANGKLKDSLLTKKKIKVSELLEAADKAQKKKKLSNEEQNKGFLNFGYDNLRELDSLQKYGPKEDKLSDWEYDIIKRTLTVKAKYNKTEMWEKFGEEAWHNIPKTLFIYMPLFAFILWIFHGKKRWFYFDHGIFTLHYFSFLLLIILLIFFLNRLIECFPENMVTSTIGSIARTIAMIWMFYYFFPAHHRFYGETRWISFIKSVAMFFINMILMTIVLLAFLIYTFINIH
ncbi:DUF3667 domain-containing protein [Flavobacterium wongokense]|uniref:DUF3667 domain-containing protein n=1 Tax=Flavobacterium wongokense TaxID=2910674 RepID=UPI001F178C36|nr:DUF3667 domain-containing protein [Flavobacterium sp. WG47]MCF6132891.1 DUF3667 domain-containing protein [Flavobacterium sp. WG47]